jgi:hypothetical protein
LVALNRNFKTKGFSKGVRKLLTASWRIGTQKDYGCKFRKFRSWCSTRNKDPFTASLIDCAEFLTFLFHEGLQYRTIAGYRSMLSAALPPVDNILIGQHPYIIRLLKGVFNLRPPVSKLAPEWDLGKVLKMLKLSPFEPLHKTSLKCLTLKTVFLTAITTFRRCSDLQSLRLGEGNVTVHSEGIMFLRQGLSKQDRPSHMGRNIWVPAFKDDKKLDPKRAIAIYLKKTESIRRSKLQDETSLFISYVKPHKAVSKQTLAKWIVQTIQMAYNTSIKVTAHSTRAIGPSWALFKGASLSSILEAADWKNESTFIRFYLRRIDPSVLM